MSAATTPAIANANSALLASRQAYDRFLRDMDLNLRQVLDANAVLRERVECLTDAEFSEFITERSLADAKEAAT